MASKKSKQGFKSYVKPVLLASALVLAGILIYGLYSFASTGTVPIPGQTATVKLTYYDTYKCSTVTSPVTVAMYPYTIPTDYGTRPKKQNSGPTPWKGTTDSNGSITFSNVPLGSAYMVDSAQNSTDYRHQLTTFIVNQTNFGWNYNLVPAKGVILPVPPDCGIIYGQVTP